MDITPFDQWLLASGVFWVATYLLIIYQGFRDRRFGMPIAALCANFAWEFVFSFVRPHPEPQVYVNYVWMAINSVILITVLRYWRADFPSLSPKVFYPAFVVGLVAAGFAVRFAGTPFDDPDGVYAAFAQNLMMSVLFIAMLRRRGSLAGQSVAIAACKFLGTLAASAAFALHAQKPIPVLYVLFVGIVAADLVYLAMTWRCWRARVSRHAPPVFGRGGEPALATQAI